MSTKPTQDELRPATELRRRMIEDMQRVGMSKERQRMYVRAVRQLAEHYDKPPDQITDEEKQEVQFTECPVQAGDTLILEEWDQETNAYTGRTIATTVTAVRRIDEAPAGSIEEATEHGSLTVQFTPARPTEAHQA